MQRLYYIIYLSVAEFTKVFCQYFNFKSVYTFAKAFTAKGFIYIMLL